jgi:hypothetical protein
MDPKTLALELAEYPSSNEEGKDNALSPLEWAILQTVVYADIFDYPLTLDEVHRYLIGIGFSNHMVEHALFDGRLVPELLAYHQNHFTLHGREQIIQTRQHRAVIAGQLWPKAIHYGRLIGSLPFVRMVAVTGALAMNNVEINGDMDFMVVTEPGRLWLCRAMVILLVRMATIRGDQICPNLFLSENLLVYSQRDLYTAHEMVQMVPLSGFEVHQRMMLLNFWTHDFLPNAYRLSYPLIDPRNISTLRIILEKMLTAPLFDRIELWEMNRKIVKFSQQSKKGSQANFGADWCKGYLDAHEQTTRSAFMQRMQVLGKELERKKLVADSSGEALLFGGEGG